MNFHALWNCALLALSLPLPAAVTLYPAGGGSNLRVPVIAPAPGGAKGKAVDFEGVRFCRTSGRRKPANWNSSCATCRAALKKPCWSSPEPTAANWNSW